MASTTNRDRRSAFERRCLSKAAKRLFLQQHQGRAQGHLRRRMPPAQQAAAGRRQVSPGLPEAGGRRALVASGLGFSLINGECRNASFRPF